MVRQISRWVLAGTVALGMVFSPATLAAERVGSGWRQAYASPPAAIRFDLPLKGIPAAPPPPPAAERTVRERVTVSLGGTRVRVRVTNEQGDKPLVITGASIALAGDRFAARGPVLPLTFGGLSSVTVPPGAPLVSDPVPLRVAPRTELLISLASRETDRAPSLASTAVAVADGNQTLAGSMAAERTERRPLIVSGVSIRADGPARVVVALGDSITYGARRNAGNWASWPDFLERRLIAREKRARIAVVNAGISGNRVLANGVGQAALVRFDRDVLAADGVTDVIVTEGTNDIGASGATGPTGVSEKLEAKDLIFAYRQMIARARARGLRIMFGTITPFGGAKQSSPEREAMRQAVNTWIMTSGEADGGIDFAAAVSDPADPARMAPAFDSGDHLHPNEAGLKAMAGAVDLSLLR